MACERIVVLGCAIRFQGTRLQGTAGARAARGAMEYARMLREGEAPASLKVLTSGGRKWDGVVEADALRDALVDAGVPRDAVIRERCSFSTRENARYVARLMAIAGEEDIVLVTSGWHMARAAALFRAEGLRVREAPAEDAWVEGAMKRGALRMWRGFRERLSAWKDGVT